MENKYSILFSEMRQAAFDKYHSDTIFKHRVHDALSQCNNMVTSYFEPGLSLSIKDAIMATPDGGEQITFIKDRFVSLKASDTQFTNPAEILDSIVVENSHYIGNDKLVTLLDSHDRLGDVEYVRFDEEALFSAVDMNIFDVQSELDAMWDLVKGKADAFLQWVDEKMDTDKRLVSNAVYYTTILHDIAVRSVIYSYCMGLITLRNCDDILVPRFILQAAVEDIANGYEI